MARRDIRTDAQTQKIVALIARGDVTSRSELSAELGLAASTVGLRIKALLEAGVVEEAGQGDSRGGRRPTSLRLTQSEGEVLSVDLGGSHARIGRHQLSGALIETTTRTIELADGPDSTIDQLVKALKEAQRGPIRGVGLSVPGPVDRDRGTIEQPSRMPGWSGYPVAAELAERLQVCVQVDNDANLAALGEHCARFGSSKHSITVKAGTAIGSGIIVNGRLHRGATAAAGDITHTRIESGNAVVCRCGNLDCLETVASGAGIIRQLNQGEYSVRQTTDVLRLVHDGDPEATRLVRAAGKHLGQALSGIVNFFNPHALFLTGSLSALEPFIASVRGRIYANCHPLVTQSLQVEATITGADAALLGAARLVLDEIGLLA